LLAERPLENTMLRRYTVNGLIWLLAVSVIACGRPVSSDIPIGTDASGTAGLRTTTRLTIFAAASLTDAFRDIGQAFERDLPGTQVAFNFAGSQQLALQLEQGAQADVFASADERSMERLIGARLIQRGDPLVFARNQMVVILPSDNPGRIETLIDLSKPGLKLILAGEQVPAGAYARQVLHNLAGDPAYGAGFEAAVLRNVVSNEENVKQVVAKVQLGEADAGMVYRSDVTPSVADKLRQIEIPARHNITAVYPIAVLSSASEPELANAFVQFVLTPDSQRRLEQWGFTRITQ